jgi:hypothetical protein
VSCAVIDECMESNRRWTLLELEAETGSLWHSLAFLPRSSALVTSHQFYKTLELQLSFYRSLCYNSRVHCPLLQCLGTISAILAGAHSYFVVSSFKCELWDTKFQCRILKCSPIIPILSKINPIPRIDTYFFNQSSPYDLISRHAVAVMHSGQ